MGTTNPASGKEVQLTGISIYRIEEGRIAQEWSVEDEYGLRWLRSARLLRPSNSSRSSRISSHTICNALQPERLPRPAYGSVLVISSRAS